ncbi:methyltransferase domain-containing protein [Nocardiopsis sp. RSe5-2]|uniref:Methyltransferase domain-containing protein n=1 Tax=Nocardiopsis endophytica TaxID=3018445 RepID=A0ABT4UA26_9ACTN|nr:methyltransferase domain-containing protein [Nocardiopsis endophytica]MDA2813192.1 methyltransferase domain-containing protein [Nocardiopsis endophytica]
MPDASPADEVKSCCAAAYGTDAVALLLGEAYHPGGLALTREMAGSLRVGTGDRVLDAACGPGATARLLAAERGARVDGVDLGGTTLERARALTREAGLEDRVAFLHGDAEHLPVPDGAYDALVCECALCTFPGKRAAAAEFARVLRPGGRLGVTDVVVEGGLPRELAGIAGWIACIADALPTAGYLELLEGAGLRVGLVERRDAALERMIDRIEARLRVLAMTAPDRLAEAGVDAGAVAPYLEAARRAVGEGRVGYALFFAEKPA